MSKNTIKTQASPSSEPHQAHLTGASSSVLHGHANSSGLMNQIQPSVQQLRPRQMGGLPMERTPAFRGIAYHNVLSADVSETQNLRRSASVAFGVEVEHRDFTRQRVDQRPGLIQFHQAEDQGGAHMIDLLASWPRGHQRSQASSVTLQHDKMSVDADGLVLESNVAEYNPPRMNEIFDKDFILR